MIDEQAHIDHVIDSFFAVFDNRNDKKPDFDSLNEMFLSEVQIYKVLVDSYQTGAVEVMDKTTFIRPRKNLFEQNKIVSFHEWETESKTTVNGMMATRVSSYAKQGRICGEMVAGTGKKHFHLLKVNNHWRIASIIWQDD